MGDSSARGIFLGPDEGTTVNTPIGGPIEFKVRGKETRGALMAFVNTVPPGVGPPLHVHASEDELLFVTDGRFRFNVGDEMHEGGPGSFLYIPRGVTHTWQNVDDRPSSMFVVFSPAGMERFFERFSEQAHDAPAAEAFRRLGSEVGMEVVGAPLSTPRVPQ